MIMKLISDITEFSIINPGWAVLLLILIIVLIAILVLGFDIWRGYKKNIKKQTEDNKKNKCGSNCPINTEKELIIMISDIQKKMNDENTISNKKLLEKISSLSIDLNNIEETMNNSFPITSELMKALIQEIKDSKEIVSHLKRILDKQTDILNSLSKLNTN